MLDTLKERLLPPPQERARRELEKQLRREAEYFAAVIQARLTQLGICYRYPKNQKDFGASGVQQIAWLKFVGTPDGVYLMLDSRRLPRGVRVVDLSASEILEDLSVACRRPVRFRYDTRCGAWFIVERASGTWGVPRRLDFGDVLTEWPHSSRKKLLVPLGIGENRRLVYRSLADFPHALIGGATGAGKTTLLHNWICSLVMHNPASELRLALIDLKGGVEFTRYRKLEHVLGVQDGDEVDGFVKRAEGVVEMLEYLRREMDGRLDRFERAGGIQSIDIWNYRRRGEKLPRMVLFVDELASLMLDKGLKGVEPILADITARGRAPGVHVVLSTQRPEVKVVSGLIKGNIDVRCAFRVPDNASSMVILDTTEAARFDDSTPLGRFIYRRGIDRDELQAPLITPGQMTEIVRDVRAGHTGGSEAAQIAPEDVFRISVQQLEGNFSQRTLYDALGGRASKRYLERLGKDYEGEVVEVDGEMYELRPEQGGSIPRMLVPVGGAGEEKPGTRDGTPDSCTVSARSVQERR